MAYDREDLGRDSEYCDRLSLARCAVCGAETDVSHLVQVPGVGQICEDCDEEMTLGAGLEDLG